MPRPSGWHRKRATPADTARARQYASPEHRAMRATITAKLAAGHPVTCWRCRRPIPNDPKAWHVGHSDDRTRLMGAECVRCNLKAAARKGARTVNAQRRRGVSRKRVVHPLNL